MRILVTGGAGYIGAQTVRLLRRRGDEVVVLDDLSTGHAEAIDGPHLVVGSIGDGALLERLLATGVAGVIHLAALKSTEDSLRDPGRYFATNMGGTLAVLRAAALVGVRWLVYSSTCAVYGTPDELPVRETCPPRPENPYGESKLLGERMLPWFDRSAGLRSVSLRYFNAAGADPAADLGEDWGRASNLIPQVMKAALGHDGPLQVFGSDYPTPDGTAIRDYVHVVDLAEAHLRALDYLAAGGASTTLNVGSGHGASVREVVDLAGRVIGQAVPVVDGPRRPGDPPAIWADGTRAREVLGWEARFDLEGIIRTAWRWHSTHPAGYERDPAVAAPVLRP